MDRQLHKAARLGDVQYLKQMGDQCSLLLLTTTPQGNTALHIAAKFAQVEFVREILRQCESLLRQKNAKGDTALHEASRAGHVELVKALISFQQPVNGPASEYPSRDVEEVDIEVAPGTEIWRMVNKENNTALHEAARNGHYEVVKILLMEDEDLAWLVNSAGESPLYLAAEMGCSDIVHKILTTASQIMEKGPDGRTPLHAAAIMGNVGYLPRTTQKDVVQELLKQRPHLTKQADTFKSTALHYASSTGNLDIAKLLLQTDPSLAYLVDENELSPLHIAAGSGHTHIVHEILELCPDTSELLDQNGQNALHVAIDSEETDVVEELLRRPELYELINEPDNSRNIPMHLAAKKENYPIVKLLLATGIINLRAMDENGHTALDCIELKSKRTYEQLLIWKALQAAGAARGQRRHSQKGSHRPTPSPTTVDESYKSMANTLSVVAALIATVTFAAIFTMPGGNKSEGSDEGSMMFIKDAAFKAFLISDTVAMCSSMIVALVLVWAVPGVPGMLVNAVGWALKLMWIALGGMMVTFVTAVYVVVSPDCMWIAVVVCVLGCSVPFFVTPIVAISARQMPHAKKDFQYDQIQPPLA